MTVPTISKAYDDSFSTSSFEDELQSSQSQSQSSFPMSASQQSQSAGGSSSDGDAQFTTKETKMMNGSKLCVYLALAIAAVAVSTAAYVVLTREEENTMEAEFFSYSREILKQAQANSENMFEELWDLSKSITSHTLDTEMTWPNCTIPHFDIRAQEKNSKVDFVGFAPFVTPENRAGWEQYSVDNQDWIAQDYSYRGSGWNDTIPMPIPPTIHRYNESVPFQDYEDDMFDYQIPLWQFAPPRKDTSVINLDLATIPVVAHLLWDIKMKKVEQYSRIMRFETLELLLGTEITADDHPRGTIYQPVFEDFLEDSEVVGFLMGSLTWDKMFENVLFGSSSSLLVEIEGTCNAVFTYRVTEDAIFFLGYGQELRDPKFDKYKQSADLLDPKGSRPGYPPVKHSHRDTDASHGQSHCTYVMNTYPTQEFQAVFKTAEPIYMALIMGSIFIFTAFVFSFYDFLVQHRQNELVTTAKRTTAIVSSLFPKGVQKRMLEEARQKEAEEMGKGKSRMGMNDYLNNQDGKAKIGAPIADLFPSATLFFGDLVGFTAWSSSREPSHVFVLLETLYASFDTIAKYRRVFKVETIGDCYVAVAGLPEARPNHAPVMARFARDCMHKMKEVMVSLSPSLGPDTCDLGMRVGLHSGPVTAGVLRGERARFQLFGDSVNTCARIETTGQRDRIHLSEQTADLLIEAGKHSWIKAREDEVEAKGKGKLRTYWLVGGDSGGASTTHHTANSESGAFDNDDISIVPASTEISSRLVGWSVQVMSKLLRQIQMRRNSSNKSKRMSSSGSMKQLEDSIGMRKTVALDEVVDIINLPIFNSQNCQNFSEEATQPELGDDVVAELTQFVGSIAAMYNDNPFHNFEHASHVTMSVRKLLSRFVNPSVSGNNDSDLDHAYGIASDPLTQFAVVLAAMIHDLDHAGIPNTQLSKESPFLASAYENKSIAEQNSFHLAWNLLMDDSFVNLRTAIYSSQDELLLFRQLLVNSVMATDIMDKHLGAARKARWTKAFAMDESTKEGESATDTTRKNSDESPDVVTNRRATIVIEHLIQASDVSHTMQHWQVYCKWNERLFLEMYTAYKEGRAEQDPSAGWYQGEIGFFDFYILPLAKKLKDCGVFGVSSDEYLIYAEQNRAEWKAKGQQQVAMYLEKYDPDSSSIITAVSIEGLHKGNNTQEDDFQADASSTSTSSIAAPPPATMPQKVKEHKNRSNRKGPSVEEVLVFEENHSKEFYFM